jgi:Clp amino terminal domain, pathogenicity island component
VNRSNRYRSIQLADLTPQPIQHPAEAVEPGLINRMPAFIAARRLDVSRRSEAREHPEHLVADLLRAADAGDLLLALTGASDTLAAKALRELGVDLKRLSGVIEHLRREGERAEEELAQRLEEVRQHKDLAIESQQLQSAARLRDEERELRQQLQARADAIVTPTVLQEIRRRLGIPSRRTDDPPQRPQS